MFLDNLFGFLSHSKRFIFIYFPFKIEDQRVLHVKPLQIFFILRAELNQDKFLMPQPPHSFGKESIAQITIISVPFLVPHFHKKLKIYLISILITKQGTCRSEKQYTRVLKRTTLIRESLPPMERRVNVQFFILLSNFSNSQCQS